MQRTSTLLAAILTAGGPTTALPHSLAIDPKEPRTVLGPRYLPRQDMVSGRIAEYEVYAGYEAQRWSDPVATGRWSNTIDMKTVRFTQPVTARYPRLVAHREVNGNGYASAAAVDVMLE